MGCSVDNFIHCLEQPGPEVYFPTVKALFGGTNQWENFILLDFSFHVLNEARNP